MGLTQAHLAAKLDPPIKQSQVSMIEQGKGGLSTEKLRALLDVLDLPLDDFAELRDDLADVPVQLGACFDPNCPSVTLDARVSGMIAVPSVVEISGGSPAFCRHCGDVLGTDCPSCGVPLHAGVFCMECGAAYIDAEVIAAEDEKTRAATSVLRARVDKLNSVREASRRLAAGGRL